MNANGYGSPSHQATAASVPVTETVLPFFFPVRIRRIRLAVLVFGIALFLLGVVVDWLLIHARGISQLGAATILDALFAIVVASLIYNVLAHDRARRTAVVERLETIDQMNHHIRNALQVISFSAHAQSNEAELAEIKRALNRIQWALSEILPKVEPEFSGFEGSLREQAKRSQLNAKLPPEK